MAFAQQLFDIYAVLFKSSFSNINDLVFSTIKRVAYDLFSVELHSLERTRVIPLDKINDLR